MSKAILVIDMPETCDDCNLCYYSDGKVQLCYWYDKSIDESKPDWCPLKPIPEKKLIWDDHDDWGEGFNNCIDELLDE